VNNGILSTFNAFSDLSAGFEIAFFSARALKMGNRMRRVQDICKRYNIALCYIFGSQMEKGKALVEGKEAEVSNEESDIDFGILFCSPPKNSLETYARLSLDLQGLVSPFRVDLLFLHEVDHIIQLEAIKGFNVFSIDEDLREDYEEKVAMFAADELEIFKLNEKDFLEAIEHGYFEFEYKADRG